MAALSIVSCYNKINMRKLQICKRKEKQGQVRLCVVKLLPTLYRKIIIEKMLIGWSNLYQAFDTFV